jgi:hypothetical protein
VIRPDATCALAEDRFYKSRRLAYIPVSAIAFERFVYCADVGQQFNELQSEALAGCLGANEDGQRAKADIPRFDWAEITQLKPARDHTLKYKLAARESGFTEGVTAGGLLTAESLLT